MAVLRLVALILLVAYERLSGSRSRNAGRHLCTDARLLGNHGRIQRSDVEFCSMG